jgi:hypothetical protein
MRDDMRVLFNEGQLRGVFDSREKKMLAALEAISAEQFRAEDDSTIITNLTSKFRIEPVELTEGATSVDAQEAKVDVSGSWERDIMDRSSPYYVPGISVSYLVPFTGDAGLFRFQPSSFTFHSPYGDVGDNAIAFHFERPDTDVAATKRSFEDELRHVKQWLSWANRDVQSFNSELEAKIGGAVASRRSRVTSIDKGIGSLGIPVRSATPTRPVHAPSSPAVTPPPPRPARYDVALSFAGEDRPYVDRVAEALRLLGVKVFYDDFEKIDLWGKNLVDHLAEVYQHRSRFVVMFVSKYYVAKAWPTHERQHAQARALLAKEEYILPARFDDTDVPGMTTTVSYIDLRKIEPEQFANLIKAKAQVT